MRTRREFCRVDRSWLGGLHAQGGEAGKDNCRRPKISLPHIGAGEEGEMYEWEDTRMERFCRQEESPASSCAMRYGKDAEMGEGIGANRWRERGEGEGDRCREIERGV